MNSTLGDSASGKLETLRLGLEFAVPLRIDELRRYTFEQRAILAEESAQIVTEKGDVILFRSKRKGTTAAAFNALVTGLACLAFQPGGVRQFGLHFKART